MPTPRAGLAFVGVVALLYLGPGTLLQFGAGEVGLLVAQWAFMLAPALLFVMSGAYAPRETLSLRPVQGRGLVGAALLVTGGLPVAWLITWAQAQFFPVPQEVIDAMEALVVAESPGRLLWLLLLLAVTPAVCEEVVFRGVLLGSTRLLSPWRIVALNGLAFATFHLSTETWARFLPAAWLGMLIAWTVWRTGSIFTGVLMHLINNGIIVLLAAAPVASEAVTDAQALPPLWLLPVSALFLVFGYRAVASLPQEHLPTIGKPDP